MDCRQWFRGVGATLVAAALVLGGCTGAEGPSGPEGAPGPAGEQGPQGLPGQDGQDGEDGENGTAGQNGQNGTDGQNGQDGSDGKDAPVVMVESCAVCHGAGRYSDVNAKHALENQVTWEVLSITPDAPAAGQLTVKFVVKVDGVARADFTNKVGGHRHRVKTDPTKLGEFERVTLATTDFTVTPLATIGQYEAVLPADSLANTIGLRLTPPGVSYPQAMVVFSYPTAPRDLVSDQSCKNCHGETVFNGNHHSANAAGVQSCVICHTRDSQSRGVPGDRLTAYVHGIHNSHNMPDHKYQRSANSVFEVGYPTSMADCSVCHDTQQRLDAVLAKPVNYSTCMSCHDKWESFGTLAVDHSALNATTNCGQCHTAGSAIGGTVGDFHNGAGGGVYFDGKNERLELGKAIRMEITEITAAGPGGALTVKWRAYNPADGTAYAPCNTELAMGPVFIAEPGPPVSNTLNMLRAYATGDDYLNDGIGTKPGQPGATLQLSAANTTCANDVATTTWTLENTQAIKGIIALQGMPKLQANGRLVRPRVPSPTREFMVANGALPDALNARRAIVDIDKCTSCHVGSLYSHGTNRIDSIELCVTCHNAASSDKDNRVGMGITAANAYDGKAGETYDLRYMLHAVHSAGESSVPWVMYRGNGIYAFGGKDTQLNHWPEGAPNCKTSATAAENNGHWVYASTGGDGPNGEVCRTHNRHAVTYPRALNDCQACHVSSFETKKLPDPRKSMALTLEPGAAPWGNQKDDVLMGATTAACGSCHQFNDKLDQNMVRAHMFQNGWVPSATVNGREDVLNQVR